jgi:asparagine synthase (glutamine-hydrolysing)
MCGIAGKVSSADPIPRGLVERMCDLLVHRGPDSSGIHRDRGAELGIRRLRVIDLETGDQPIYNEDRSIAVVLNGEIYNYEELRRDLSKRGHTFSTNGDTEVLAHLYEDHGIDLVHQLDGMFAFALWDQRRRRLLLARDRVGKKPLFYAAGDDWLSFASELAALTADSEIRREIDHDALASFLTYGYIPAPQSIWRGVRKLPPAHRLVWQSGQVTIERYWSLDYSKKREEDPRELAEELRRLVGAAVRRRMIADVPLGAFLSGGVDSSIVVAEMAAAASEPVKTFSIGFDETGYDELPRARTVANLFATDHHEFVVQPDAMDMLPTLVRHYGEPYADSSALPSFCLAQLTRQHVTVALNGDGGDESFAGYLRHTANALTAGVDRLPSQLRLPAVALGRRLPEARGNKSALSRARRLLVPIADDPISRYIQHVSILGPDDFDTLLDPDFARDLDFAQARSVIANPWVAASNHARLDTILDVDVNTYLPGDLLVKIDIATMAYGLEARSPLLDRHVMEFAAALRPRHKATFGKKKLLLRRAYRGRIPDAVLDGPKRGFAVPIDAWFRGQLASSAREVLLDPSALGRGYFVESGVRSILDDHVEGRRDSGAQIWALLNLELWHREVERASEGHQAVAAGVTN